MAAHLARSLKLASHRQFRSTIRLWQKVDSNNFNQSYPRVSRVVKLVATGTVGTGTSYAFLGLSFGKKEEKEVDPLTKLYRKARIAHHDRKDFEAADNFYHETLKLANERLKRGKITEKFHVTTQTVVYDGLADIALKTGQFDKARDLLLETIKGFLQQGYETNNNVIIDLSLKLSSVYAILGKKEEAEEGYRFCVHYQSAKMEEKEKEWKKQLKEAEAIELLYKEADKLEQKEQDTAVLMGMALGSYGRFLLAEKRYKEALPHLERALLYALHTMGTYCNQYVVMLNDIATLHIMDKNYPKAEGVLNTAIDISEKAKLEEGAVVYCNLGAVHLRRGHTEKANEACQRASDLARKFDHAMAFKMADACMKKCSDVQKKASIDSMI